VKPSSTIDALHGRALLWGIWDPAGVVAAALNDMLNCHMLDNQLLDYRPVSAQGETSPTPAIRARMLRGESPEQLEQLANQRTLGLATWVLAASTEEPADPPVTIQQVTAVCQAVASLRDKHSRTICVCLLDPWSSHHFGMLVAAGMQLTVSDLPSLHRGLPRIVAQAPLASHGYHPLTTGLVSRLPWSV
jgi:hypothetical protein